MIMKRQLLALGLLVACAFTTLAATPPPEKLLPADTVAVVTVPDFTKASATWKQAPASLLWADPAMKAFKDKFMGKFRSDLVEPMEKELGIKFSEYSELAQGQVTFALTANEWDQAGTPKEPGVLILLDAREKSDSLKAKLAALKTKWVDSGKQVRVEKIRDVEFTVLIFKQDDLKKSLEKVFPDAGQGDAALEPPKPGDAEKGKNMELMVGQSGTLLVVGTVAKHVEKVLANQAGAGTATLSEQASYAASHGPLFRDAQMYGWINTKSFLDTAVKALKKESGEGRGRGGMGMEPDKLLSALGIMGLQTVAFNFRDTGDGSMMGFNLAVPESQRRGLFKLISFEAKDANPPAFVPADVVKFSRIRLDLQKSWAALEAAVVEAVPQAGTLIKMMMDNAGKDKDPNFDLRKNLIANLGDDVITYQKAPRKQTLEDLNSPPALFLIGSPRAEQVASAIKALGAVMPQPKVKEREFLGRTVYALGLPPSPSAGGGRPVERALHYAASGGYVAMSTDVAMLEEFLRSGDSTAKALRDLPGLNDAAQKVGGMAKGMFGYENQAESMRAAVETLKKDSGNLASLFGGTPMAGQLEDSAEKLKDWIDFSLLPSFDKISKYFYISVASGAVTSEGMGFKVYNPNPPQLKK